MSYDNNEKVGTATVKVIGIGRFTGEKKVTFEILSASIKDAEISLPADSPMYSGLAITPNPTVKLGEDTLKEGIDYNVDYSNNIDAGTGVITITGQGNYIENCTKEFIIDPSPIDKAEVNGIVDKTYNGSAWVQTPDVKLGDTTLTKETDYEVSYTNNTYAGIASMTITGKGNYTGSITKEFEIKKAVQDFTVKAAASAIDIGKTTRVTASGAKETRKYTFTSSNNSIAVVSADGIVTGKAAGTVTITVRSEATTNYDTCTKSVKITINKVLKKPGNCHFVKWNNSKYTSCRISWNKVAGAEGYQALLSWTDGSHASAIIVKSNVLYRDCTVVPNHVSQMKARAFYTVNGQRKYSPWSNVEYITPSPTKMTYQNASVGNTLKAKISWNIIYGCNGYNVFITTNPNGKWYWDQSTPVNAASTSATVDKCGGAKLKKNTRYYIRIVTRRKRNGVFCTVPMPASNTNIGSFVIK